MAKMHFNTAVARIDELLRHGKRDEAKELVVATLAKGEACPQAQRVAAELFGANRGRPTGLYKWIEIGKADEALIDERLKYEDRVQRLAVQFNRSDSHIVRCLAVFTKAKEEANEEALAFSYETYEPQ